LKFYQTKDKVLERIQQIRTVLWWDFKIWYSNVAIKDPFLSFRSPVPYSQLAREFTSNDKSEITLLKLSSHTQEELFYGILMVIVNVYIFSEIFSSPTWMMSDILLQRVMQGLKINIQTQQPNCNQFKTAGFTPCRCVNLTHINLMGKVYFSALSMCKQIFALQFWWLPRNCHKINRSGLLWFMPPPGNSHIHSLLGPV